MHKKWINELRIKLDITTSGPLLIASGIPEDEDRLRNGDGGSAIKFVAVRRNNTEAVYLPGSSLKGVIRSYCEKIARTVVVSCCNPLLNRDEDKYKPDCSCGKKVETEKEQRNSEIPVPEIYKDLSCYVCKLFGSTGIAGRIYIEDAYPTGNSRLVRRVSNAIDRTTGAVYQHAGSGALFSMEVAGLREKATFTTEIHVRNFELWQLGLLGLAMRDLHRERIRIGFAKSRGLGKVKGTIKELTITYPFYNLTTDRKKIRSLANGNEKTLFEDGKFHIYGVGSLMGDDGSDYGYCIDDEAEIEVPELPEAEADWISSEIMLSKYQTQVEPLLRICVEEHWIPKVTSSQGDEEAQEA